MAAKKRDPVLQAVLDARRPVDFRKLETLLKQLGFRRDRIRGSHRIYSHPKSARLLNLQPRGHEAKPYQLRQLRDIILEFGLMDDLE
jgi:predicted RNA binding protein YcfA (HicA-like mRNA interferase family)